MTIVNDLFYKLILRLSMDSKKIDWTNSLFLILTPLLTIVFTTLHIIYEGFNFWLIIPFVAMYFITGFSITAGYHRLFSHRSYQAHPVVKFIYLVFGAAAFENTALKWCHDHRIHHRHCDQPKDPYNIQKGFFHAHMGWIMWQNKNEPKSISYPKDLESDPLVIWQHRYYLPLAVMFGFGLPLYIGHLMGSPLGGLAIVGLGRVVFVHHMTFFINSLCHMVGSQPYTDTNSARDSWIMALFSYGEGYHNFHHFFQSDYRNGIKWYHFDPTKWVINSLSYLGLATNLKTTNEEEILRARLHMEHKNLTVKNNHPLSLKNGEIQSLVERIDEHLQQLIILKRKWKKPEYSHEIRCQLQEKMQQIQKDLTEWFNLWASQTNSRLSFKMN